MAGRPNRRAKAPAWTADQDQELRDMHAAFWSVASMAAKVKRPPRTVRERLDHLGLTLDAADLEQLRERQARNRERQRLMRQEAIDRQVDELLATAARCIARAREPYEVIQYVGKDGLRVTDDLLEPTPGDSAQLTKAAATALAAAERLMDRAEGVDVDAGRSMLTRLSEELAQAGALIDQAEETAT